MYKRNIFYPLLLIQLICCNLVRMDDYVDETIVSKEVKCLVCKVTVIEMYKNLKKVDPLKKVDVSGFRMAPDGSSVTKRVQLSKSEVYLTELMEDICDQMDDYAKARYKTTRELTVLKLMSDDGGMNPDLSLVDFIQDGDLNKSLKHYCLEILDDSEKEVLDIFMQDTIPSNPDVEICIHKTKYCEDNINENVFEQNVKAEL